MYRFIESIRLNEGEIENLIYHQARVERTFLKYFDGSNPIDLNQYLLTCPFPSVGLHKIRLVYDRAIQSILISSYSSKTISSLKLVNDDTVKYEYKYEDRGKLKTLFDQRQLCDEVIITKDGFITDSSVANLVFKRKDKWLTPFTYLLNGTQRQFLLDQKIIEEEKITINDLHRYEKVKLINAMLKFDAPEISINQIV
ncbi:MAG: hypothetical protein OJF59_000439 [Cytophagales bacterium]|jgi:4-amino-4-deoxychorismate lyase|nr:aminotransferase class IV [Bacteroidota bacterium]MBS1982382.1 aminotransferase class IV [Bacteroidota bacterium]WHZ06686.1 MAG: hypothetical protein OJF59_000439 [Cytophagales bacterium]